MINLRMKALFFDRQAVMRAVDAATRRNLSKGGAFVRRTAKSSIRPARMKSLAEMSSEELRAYRIARAIAKREGRRPPKRPKASSKPGEPPRSQKGLLKKFIYFAYEPDAGSVVIGPEKLARSTGAPEILEHSGTATITKYRRRNGRRVRVTKRRRITARPYMGPALTKEAPKLAELWRNSVKGD